MAFRQPPSNNIELALSERVYLYRIRKFVAAQRCFRRKHHSAYPTLPRSETASPLLVPL